MQKMVVLLGPCHSRRQNLFASTTPGDTCVCLHPLLLPSPPCSLLQDHIYFITASNSEGFVLFANLDFLISQTEVFFSALWRCAFKSSSGVPEQVLALKVPAVCIASWYERLFETASAIVTVDFRFHQRR
jgi:hypothetical protein